MKKSKGLFEMKRAFSPVIAALILMLLAVAAGVVVYTYTMGWIGGATKSEGGQYGELSLDSAYANASEEKVYAYVRNIGGKSVTPDEAYVNDKVTSSISSSPATITEGSSATVTITCATGVLVAETTYEVKIVCTGGTSLTFNVKAVA